jgi:ABC-type multidrug transport system ATPase subunit
MSYRRLNKLFPFSKKQSKSTASQSSDATSTSFNIEEGEEGQFENNRNENVREIRKPSVITTPEPTQKIDVSFSELQLTLPNGKCIMQGVSGALKSGQFTAIMGPSGAGKSTFLALLSGKVEPTAGRLEVNGEKTSLTKFKKLVGFVPQEDIMLRELTVEENIRHSAFMRLPAEWTREQKVQRVAHVMDSLELTQIKDSIIGDEIRRGISGGQRKRVNVAMELVADPSLLALDEPTSGLDSTTSYSLTETLHSLAKTGVNVAAVLHQPKNEIFEVRHFILVCT